ncbi:hypothetical protein C2S52_010577 [Perilla frutescens var. hirtella]|nr:hypothetical protein C2S52_010577 [Perilla frutescens var. hirtella]
MGISRVMILPRVKPESIISEEMRGVGGFEGEIEIWRSVTVKLGREFGCSKKRCSMRERLYKLFPAITGVHRELGVFDVKRLSSRCVTPGAEVYKSIKIS